MLIVERNQSIRLFDRARTTQCRANRPTTTLYMYVYYEIVLWIPKMNFQPPSNRVNKSNPIQSVYLSKEDIY